MIEAPLFRQWPRVDYLEALAAMEQAIEARTSSDRDEIWILEHPSVYTLGQGASEEDFLSAPNYPVIRSNRGGKITYHGPGQCIIYLLIDPRRWGWAHRGLVSFLEDSCILFLKRYYDLDAHARPDAPGVYLESGEKIAFLGLRFRRGYAFHGLALNVDLDLEPFERIVPCGLHNVRVTRLCDWCQCSMADIRKQWEDFLSETFLERLKKHVAKKTSVASH